MHVLRNFRIFLGPDRRLPFLLQDWLHGFPGLFTDTSEHIRFLLSFSVFPLFSCWFREVDRLSWLMSALERPLNAISHRIVSSIANFHSITIITTDNNILKTASILIPRITIWLCPLRALWHISTDRRTRCWQLSIDNCRLRPGCSKPAACRCWCRSTGQTDGRTDGRTP